MDIVDTMLLANGTGQNLEDTNITLTYDQFKQLVGRIQRKATFAPCKRTYDGTRNIDNVECFLSVINCFKEIENISDEDALIQIPMLLRGEAGIWYCNTRDTIQTWDAFQTSLRKFFAPQAYIVYQEIFAKQQFDQPSEYFINRKRMLFTLLPPPEYDESQQLDMMYCTLSREIQDKVPRDSFTTFDELLENVKAIKEVPSVPTSSFKAPKPRCRYCRLRGHNAEECLKKKRVENSMENRDSSAETESEPSQAVALPETVMSPMSPDPEPKFSCFGCGAPGIVRSKCPKCLPTLKWPSHLRVDFH